MKLSLPRCCWAKTLFHHAIKKGRGDPAPACRLATAHQKGQMLSMRRVNQPGFCLSESTPLP